jgi:hypothetical protein
MVAAMAERAMAEDRREKVLANVRAVRERAEAQGDPLGIRRRPAATETRKASGQAAASVRKVRDPLLRSSGSVRRLMTQGVIGRREFLAADRLAELWHCAVGGALVRALDWTLERVDGGRGLIEPEMLIGAGAAERELWLVRCHVGVRAWTVLLRVCCQGESVTSVAVDMEEDPTAHRNGACSRQTRDHISRLLRGGLADAAEVMGLSV